MHRQFHISIQIHAANLLINDFREILSLAVDSTIDWGPSGAITENLGLLNSSWDVTVGSQVSLVWRFKDCVELTLSFHVRDNLV